MNHIYPSILLVERGHFIVFVIESDDPIILFHYTYIYNIVILEQWPCGKEGSKEGKNNLC